MTLPANVERLAAAGLPVFPVGHNKKPLVSDWPNVATSDTGHLAQWFGPSSVAAPAIALEKTDLVVVDLDRHEGGGDGISAFTKLANEHGGVPAEAPIVKTPSGGWHIYFRQPASGERIRNSAGRIAAGIDVRADGGYIITPGSRLGSGREYVSAHKRPELVEAIRAGTIPPLPEWLATLARKSVADEVRDTSGGIHAGIQSKTAYALAALNAETGRVSNAAQGQRNHTLNAAAFALGQLVGGGLLSRTEVESALVRAAAAAGLSKSEALPTIQSGLTNGEREPRTPPNGNGRQTSKESISSDGASQPLTRDQWPEPKPLPSGLLPVMPFQFDYLPASIGPWVADISDRMQCPPDFVAIPALVAMGATLGRKVAIRPQRRTDWLEVPNLWGMIVGRPGAMKTPATTEALKPLTRLEAKARESYEAEVKTFAREVEITKLRRDEASKEARSAIKNGRDPAAFLTIDDPAEPVDRRFIVNDTSYEKLGEIMANNPSGVMAYRDELVSLLRTLDREDNAAARGFYLTAWSGTSSYTFDRIVRGKKHIEAACLSLLGGTQPGRLAEYMRRAVSGGESDDGLIQRFGLLVWPDQSPEWKEVDRYPDTEARQKAWEIFEAFEGLLPEAIGAEVDQFGGLPFLRFSDAGAAVFSEWRADLEARLRGGDLSAALESHLSKYRKLIPALALINHLAEGGVGPVSEAATLRALSLAEYLESHAKRAYAAGSEAEAAAAKAILSVIRKGEVTDGFTLRDIHQRGWSNLTDRDQVKAGINLLCDLDWLASQTSQTGGRPRTIYTINPRGQA